MKEREINLREIIKTKHSMVSHSKPNWRDFSRLNQEKIHGIYKTLGGISVIPPNNPGPWDIISENFIIELDEEQHFNRYRLMTLQSSIYENNKMIITSQYREYCSPLFQYENNCIKKASYGKYWSSTSTVKQFGIADLPKTFGEHGSPRWKQRAFYDFVRDVYSIENKFPVIRVSIYDEVLKNGVSYGFVGELLKNKQKTEILTEYLFNRINTILQK